jgi:hypothetical protein
MKQPPSSFDLKKLAASVVGLGFTVFVLIFFGHYLDTQLNTGAFWETAGAITSIVLLIVSLFGFVVTILRRGQ